MRSALIVGAGIGGLAAGLALQRAGWQVRILERSDVPRADGFALGLAPNAMTALRELGVEGGVRSRAVMPRLAELRQPGGRVLRRVDLARFGALEHGMGVILRPALHEVLLAAVGRDQVTFDCGVTGFTATKDGVTLRMRDGRSAAGEILIGADGVGSVIRRSLWPDEALPRQSGYWAVRGVAHDAGGALGNLDGVAYVGDGLESATVRASPDGIYWYLSILAGDLPPDTRAPKAIVEQLTAGFEDRYHAITGATRDGDIRLDELFDRDPIDSWGAGPVTLLGDAAHPMLPHTGQGAAQALEDAVALGLVLSKDGPLDQALRTYERVRSRRTGAIVRQGRRIARVTTTRTRLVQQLRDTAVRLIPDAVIAGGLALAGRQDPHRTLRSSPLP
jgi:2-polyprenyl-6-methoxyphenol hydroxylase-like FAD-dependent oxidoreductase